MKIHSKLVRSLAETKKYLFVLLPMMAMVLLPSFAHARNERLYNVIFCKQLPSIKSVVIGKVNRTFADQLPTDEYENYFEQSLKQRKIDRDTKRSEIDGLIKSYLLSIKDRTVYITEKKYIEKFENDVDKIIKTHRDAIDTINNEYENELRENAKIQQEKIGVLVKDYKNKVENLFNNMSYKCKNPQDLGNYRSMLKSDLRNLRNEIIEKEKVGGTLEETVGILLQKRNERLINENETYNKKINDIYLTLISFQKK